MEEYDDLDQGPNEDGSFNLSYNEWHKVPFDLCQKYSDRLLYLNLSHNCLKEITEQIGNLSLLKELNLSHNNLRKIDVAMGKCIRLRKLDVSHNQLMSIPKEVISQCKFLESLLLNNNELCSLPDELCRLHALEVLDVRENNLESLPTELHSIKCLKKLQCGGNDRMSIIPELMRDDSALVLWTLKLHHIFKDQIKHLKAEYSTIERQTKNIHGMRLLREEENKRLFNEVKELERDRPVVYIRRKESFIKFIKKCKARMQKFRNRMKISYG